MEQCGCRCELRSKAKVFVHPTQLALAYAPEAVYLPHMLDKISGSVRLEAEWRPTGERFFSLSDASQEDWSLRHVGIAAAPAGSCQDFQAQRV